MPRELITLVLIPILAFCVYYIWMALNAVLERYQTAFSFIVLLSMTTIFIFLLVGVVVLWTN